MTALDVFAQREHASEGESHHATMVAASRSFELAPLLIAQPTGAVRLERFL